MEMEMEAKNNAGVGAGTGTGRRTRMNLQMPIGYRFCPTDQELIIHYLRPKVFNFPLPAQDAILHYSYHLFLHHPSHLPGDLKEKRYFFCKNIFPAKTEAGLNSLSGGYWKPIVKNNNTHKLILAPGCNHPIGLKRCYVFYQFRESHSLRAFKTPWILNEFRLLHSQYLYPLLFKMDRGNVEEWTVCSIHMKKKKKKKRKARNQDKGSAKRHKKTEVIKAIVIDDFSSPVEDTNGYGPAGQPASSSCSGITVLSHHHHLHHEQEESSITHHR